MGLGNDQRKEQFVESYNEETRQVGGAFNKASSTVYLDDGMVWSEGRAASNQLHKWWQKKRWATFDDKYTFLNQNTNNRLNIMEFICKELFIKLNKNKLCKKYIFYLNLPNDELENHSFFKPFADLFVL